MCAVLITASVAVPCRRVEAADWTVIFEGASSFGVGGVLAVILAICGIGISTELLDGTSLVDLWDEFTSQAGDMADRAGAWMEQAQKGIVDTSSDVWDSLLEFIGEKEEVKLGQGNDISDVMFTNDTVKYIPSRNQTEAFKCDSGSCYVFFVYTEGTTYFAHVVAASLVQGEVVRQYFCNGNASSASSAKTLVNTYTCDNSYEGFYYSSLSTSTAVSNYPHLHVFSSVAEAYDYIFGASGEWTIVNEAVHEQISHARFDSVIDGKTLTGDQTLDLTGVIDVWGSVETALEAITSGLATWQDLINALDAVVSVPVADADAGTVDYVLTDEGVSDVPLETVTDTLGELDDYKVDLTSFFPFCIPFDLYKLLNVLCAEPEAPCFDWTFYNPVGEDITITIDLSVFDTVANILRMMECLLFTVGLVLITRTKLLGGQ